MLKMREVLKMKISKRGGFTLAELLVVVAIIAILVAVSIPIFTGKLNEARQNTDKANVRAAKAAMVTEFLQAKEQKTDTMWYDAENGKMVAKGSLDKGYNKAEEESIDSDGAVVEVTITLKTGSEAVDTVVAKWVKATKSTTPAPGN